MALSQSVLRAQLPSQSRTQAVLPGGIQGKVGPAATVLLHGRTPVKTIIQFSHRPEGHRSHQPVVATANIRSAGKAQPLALAGALVAVDGDFTLSGATLNANPSQAMNVHALRRVWPRLGLNAEMNAVCLGLCSRLCVHISLAMRERRMEARAEAIAIFALYAAKNANVRSTEAWSFAPGALLLQTTIGHDIGGPSFEAIAGA